MRPRAGARGAVPAMQPGVAHPWPAFRQRSEQYFTWSQSRSHFFRQAKGRPHAMQHFVGRRGFFCMAAGVGGATASGSAPHAIPSTSRME